MEEFIWLSRERELCMRVACRREFQHMRELQTHGVEYESEAYPFVLQHVLVCVCCKFCVCTCVLCVCVECVCMYVCVCVCANPSMPLNTSTLIQPR